MQSTLNPKQNDDPHDILVVAPDVALVVPTDEELSRLAHSMRHPPGPETRAGSGAAAAPTVPPVDTTFRPAVSDVPGRRTIGARATRVFTTALLFALGTGAVAFAWESYGDRARQMIAPWVPQQVLAALLPADKPALPAPAVVETATVDTAPPSAPAAQAAPAAAAPPVETAEQLRSMAQDIAGMGQEIAQLKASIEELKSGRQQMSRETVKPAEARISDARASENRASENRAAEPNLRPRIASLPPRPPARVRKPAPPLPAQQAATYPPLPLAAAPQAAAPYVPRQAEPPPQAADQTLTDPELTSVPRPPMPLR